jgi:hypothetical protein
MKRTVLAAVCSVALVSGAYAQEPDKALIYEATEGISCATMAKDFTAKNDDASANLHKAQIAAFLRGWVSAMNMTDSSASTNVLNGHDPQGLVLLLGLYCHLHQVSPREPQHQPTLSHTVALKYTPL